MGDAVQKGFFFPGRFAGGSINDDRRFGIVAAEAVNGPDDFHVHQIRVQNARRDQAMREQRLGFVHGQAVDDAILRGIQTRANRFGEIRMIGQNQEWFSSRAE